MKAGRVLGQKFYTVMLPYQGYWPEVHEIRYEPSEDEHGAEVRLHCLRGALWRSLTPGAGRFERTDVEMGEGRHPVPLKNILSIENTFFEAYGPAAYEKYRACGIRVTHLVLERDGEVLADYLATFGYSDRVPQLITFGDTSDASRFTGYSFVPPLDIPHAGTVDAAKHPETLPAPAKEVDARRQLSDEDLRRLFDETLARVKDRPVLWNQVVEAHAKDLVAGPIRELARLNVQPGDVLLVKLGDPATGWIPGPEAEARILELLKAADLSVPAIVWNYAIDVSSIRPPKEGVVGR